jgi:hypothetical protein
MKRLMLAAFAVGALVHGGDAAAQTLSGSWVLLPPPKREVLVGFSLLSLKDFEPGRAVSGRYIRNVGPDLGVEAGLDVGSAAGEPFGLAIGQVRVAIPDTRPSFQFIALGVAAGLADQSHPAAPRGAGWLLGGGIHGPLPRRMGFRLEAQLLMFSRNEAEIRIMVGLSKGRG